MNSKAYRKLNKSNMLIDLESEDEMGHDLENSIKNEEIILYYQPQINIKNSKLLGLEALIRWKHPTKGLISPESFIPIAEETGLIAPLGKYVMHKACEQNKEWQLKGYPPVSISVNISAYQFQYTDLLKIVAEILKDTKLEAKWLKLEITESIGIDNISYAISIIEKFKEHGIRVSLDDFGTGYSSLDYLRKLPISEVKIDQSFIKDIMSDLNSQIITQSIIELAHKLNLTVVAEGVEKYEQLEFLRKHNCDEVQGYIFMRPLPSEEIEWIVKKGEIIV